MVDEIHTVAAIRDGDEIATIRGMLNDGDTPDTLRIALKAALWDLDETRVLEAFDAAFDACEAVPGDGAQGEAVAEDVTIRITRTIG